MKKNKIKSKIPAVMAALAVVNMQSCGKYEEGPAFSLLTKKARLTGEWQLEKITDQSGNVTSFNSTNEVEYEFEKDGDVVATQTYSYGGTSYSYSYKGDWEWEDKKEAIEITIAGSRIEYDILRLTNKELILEDDYLSQYEFEKQ